MTTTRVQRQESDERSGARRVRLGRAGALGALALVLVAATACRPVQNTADGSTASGSGGTTAGGGNPAVGTVLGGLTGKAQGDAAKISHLINRGGGGGTPTAPSTVAPSSTPAPAVTQPADAQVTTPPVDTNPYPNPVFSGASIYDPGVVSYQNPSGDGGWAYYVASGGGAGPVYSTLDRRTYTPVGNLLSALPGGADHIGSPQIYQFDGTWHAYFGIRWSDGDSHDCIGSATGGPVASSAPVNMTPDPTVMRQHQLLRRHRPVDVHH